MASCSASSWFSRSTFSCSTLVSFFWRVLEIIWCWAWGKRSWRRGGVGHEDDIQSKMAFAMTSSQARLERSECEKRHVQRTSSSRSTSTAKCSFSFLSSSRRLMSLLMRPSSSASVRLNISIECSFISSSYGGREGREGREGGRGEERGDGGEGQLRTIQPAAFLDPAPHTLPLLSTSPRLSYLFFQLRGPLFPMAGVMFWSGA